MDYQRERQRRLRAWLNSPHLRLQAAYFARYGSLPEGRIPGCVCEDCLPRPKLPSRADRISAGDMVHVRQYPILDAARRLGLGDGKRQGHEWRVLCPFHADRSPSLALNPQKNRAFCNVCAKSWDTIQLARDVKGLSFIEAVKWLLNTR